MFSSQVSSWDFRKGTSENTDILLFIQLWSEVIYIRLRLLSIQGLLR